MPNFSKIAQHIDKVAEVLETKGYLKEAEQLDAVSDTLDAMELEAGFLSKFLGGLGISLGMLGALTPTQAQQIERGWAKLSPQQTEALKKTDPASYSALQEGINKVKMSPGMKTQRQLDLPDGPVPTGNEPILKGMQIHDNPSRGPGQAVEYQYEDEPSDLVGDAPSTGGGYGGSKRTELQQQGKVKVAPKGMIPSAVR
jgi:hypothetical protein